jgi:heme-degrading monooxygenase HmoA
MSKTDGHIFRVDKFVVPETAREEFLRRVVQTHELLRTQAGFVRDLILEQTGGPGAFNIVTLVEWESEAAVDPVRAAVAAFHARIGFDPQAFFARAGIKPDIGLYRQAAE